MTRTIAMLIYEGAQGLDISGPMEAFALASRQVQEDDPGTTSLYQPLLIAEQAGPVRMASGIRLHADHALPDAPGDIDTLLVSGGMGKAVDRACENRTLLDWIGARAQRVRRIGSVCNGALLLGAAGVLDGREATTHWMDAATLQQRHPLAKVSADAIYLHDGRVWTSAGITAGMDMALAMISADQGNALALKVAKRMVMFARRSGGQSQFSRHLEAQAVPDPFAALARWLREHLQQRLDTAALAEQVHLSPRQFARRFAEVFGTTPQRYIEQLRIEAAKPLLEHTGLELKRVAHETGFGSEEAMRRAFVRRLGVRPGEYRERFGMR